MATLITHSCAGTKSSRPVLILAEIMFVLGQSSLTFILDAPLGTCRLAKVLARFRHQRREFQAEDMLLICLETSPEQYCSMN